MIWSWTSLIGMPSWFQRQSSWQPRLTINLPSLFTAAFWSFLCVSSHPYWASTSSSSLSHIFNIAQTWDVCTFSSNCGSFSNHQHGLFFPRSPLCPFEKAIFPMPRLLPIPLETAMFRVLSPPLYSCPHWYAQFNHQTSIWLACIHFLLAQSPSLQNKL